MSTLPANLIALKPGDAARAYLPGRAYNGWPVRIISRNPVNLLWHCRRGRAGDGDAAPPYAACALNNKTTDEKYPPMLLGASQLTAL